jgi:NAD(P)-dependent dehydrogenase (short-subunit alcohol dehydrogenase family)
VSELAGRYAVTGAGSGIGRGVAVALAAAGADVVVLDIDKTAATAVADEVDGVAQVLDVGDPDAVEDVFATLGRLDGLVCSAGISEHAPLVELTPTQWHRVLRVNQDGTFYCVQAAAREMLRDDVAGSIVVISISSVNARFAHRGHTAYAASKASVEMLVKVAALELAAAGIRVNAVAPGIVESGMTRAVLDDPDFVRTWSSAIPLGRLGRPDDVADIVTFLCSSGSRWLTGQVLAADGGGSLRVEPKIHDQWPPPGRSDR